MRSLLVATLLAAAAPAFAHDFWLRPEAFAVAPGQPLGLAIQIGHGREVDSWAFGWDRLHSFTSIGPAGVRDQQAALAPAAHAPDAAATVTLAEPGTHMLVVESYHSRSDLPGDKFTAYAELEGLTAAIKARKAAGTTEAPGRELYSRRAKALVQVGKTLSDVTRPIGLTLEIVPGRNPYAPSTDNRFPVQILFQGRPLAGALVDLTALDLGTEPFQPQRTDAQGGASFEIPRDGAWKINVIWARPMTGHADAEFDTVFSSLTFGYPRTGNAQLAR
jgi:uncharacterized GH25 family protein